MYRLDGKNDETLTHLIRGGFLNIDEVKETFLREHFEHDDAKKPDGVDEEIGEISAEIDRRFADKIIDDEAITDFLYERLDDAFGRLSQQDSVVARHHVGGNRQVARDEVGAICLELGGSAAGILGGLFYTDQDLEQAISDGVLRLGFFAVGPDPTACDAGLEKMMPLILRRLGEVGLPVHWGGDHHHKIEIRPITWSKASPAPNEALSVARHAYRSPLTAGDPADLDESPAPTDADPTDADPVDADPVDADPADPMAAAHEVPPSDTPAVQESPPEGNVPEEEAPEEEAPEDKVPKARPTPSPSPGPAPVRPTSTQPNAGLLGRLGKRLFKR